MKMKMDTGKAQNGFSLLELLVAMAIFAILMAALFLQIQTAQQRSVAERNQVDLFQESREFMDQMSRDLRQVGYPNPRNFDGFVLTASNPDPTASTAAAVGLVKVNTGALWFEGGLDDSGNVLFTQYDYDPATTGNCPCLKRSQQTRAAIPGSETPNYAMEVQYVQNFSDPNNQIPVFTFYTQGGTIPVPAGSLPLVWGTNNPDLAAIDTIRIQLIVQSPYKDLKTGKLPIVTLVSTVKVNNCSQSTTGTLSCQN